MPVVVLVGGCGFGLVMVGFWNWLSPFFGLPDRPAAGGIQADSRARPESAYFSGAGDLPAFVFVGFSGYDCRSLCFSVFLRGV